MPALLGIVGEGSAGELRSMAARMAYRGAYLRMSSPAPGVLFGELHAQPGELDADTGLALDADACAGDRVRLATELRQRGTGSLDALAGSFALAHWDRASKAVTLATDRLGFKSCYCVELPGRIAFASDYKALLALDDCPAELDRDALQTYLAHFSVPAGRSLLKGIRPLARAARWLIRDGHVTLDHGPVPPRERAGLSFSEAARALRARLEAAVAAALAGAESAGMLLSGGLDSLTLLALVRRVRPDLRLTTYTIGHGADDRDIAGARMAAAHFGCEHHERVYDPGCLARDLPRVVWQTEDLSGRDEAVLQSTITGVAAANHRFVLSGYGADALFAGMPRHRILWLRDRVPPPLRGALCEFYVYTQYRRRPESWLGRGLVALAYRGHQAPPPRIRDARTIGADADCPSLEHYLGQHTAPTSGFQHDEPELAAQGASLGMPFLAPDVVRLARACPASYHIGLREQKRLLRAAVSDLLPESMRGIRKTIQRFRHDRALTGVVLRIAQDLDLERSLSDRGLVDRGDVGALTLHAPGDSLPPERLHTLWGLISAELWMRQFLDRRGLPLEASA